MEDATIVVLGGSLCRGEEEMDRMAALRILRGAGSKKCFHPKSNGGVATWSIFWTQVQIFMAWKETSPCFVLTDKNDISFELHTNRNMSISSSC